MALLNVVEPKVADGAIYLMEDFKMPDECLFHNFNRIYEKVCHLVKRTYESPFKWYFLTFKPFNKNYERDLDFYKNKAFDHCRKKVGKVKAFIMTREIDANKVHVNMLCCTDRNLDLELHEKQTNKYFIFCEEAVDRHKTLQYILKEARTRFFKIYKDYQFFG